MKKVIAEVVSHFSSEMVEKMIDNLDEKGISWREASVDSLAVGLYNQLDKLNCALNISVESSAAANIKAEMTQRVCVNIANYAMMIFDQFDTEQYAQ